MVRTPKYELIQDRLGVPLDKQLREWRVAELSTLSIAQRLRAATGVPVTGETIRQWLMDLPDANEAA